MSQNLIPWPFVPTPVKPSDPVIKPISPTHEGSLGSIFGTNPNAPADPASPDLSNGFLQALAFVILSIGLILLAGPFPTLVNGILVLILSSVILGHYMGFEVTIQTLTKWLQGNG
jgi:hypothetical protein